MFCFNITGSKQIQERENQMAAIQKAGWDFAKMAAKRGQKLMNVPLKDQSNAKVLWNKNSVDCFIMKDGKMVEARGAQGNPDFIKTEIAKILDKLHKVAEPGFEMFTNFVKAGK